MPNKHKHKLVGIRGAPEELVEKVKESAPDGNLSKLTIAFWRWYAAEDGAPPPSRPSDATQGPEGGWEKA